MFSFSVIHLHLLLLPVGAFGGLLNRLETGIDIKGPRQTQYGLAKHHVLSEQVQKRQEPCFFGSCDEPAAPAPTSTQDPLPTWVTAGQNTAAVTSPPLWLNQTVHLTGHDLATYGNATFKTVCASTDRACYSSCTAAADACASDSQAWLKSAISYLNTKHSTFVNGTFSEIMTTVTYTYSESARTYSTYSTTLIGTIFLSEDPIATKTTYTTYITTSKTANSACETSSCPDSLESLEATMKVTKTRIVGITTWFTQWVPYAIGTGSAYSTSAAHQYYHTDTAGWAPAYPTPFTKCSLTNRPDLECSFSKDCSKCTIYGGTVQLLYFPATRTQSANETVLTPGWQTVTESASHSTTTSAPDLPSTLAYLNTTLTAPSVYISFHTAYAEDECGGQVGGRYPGAILALPPSELSSVLGGWGVQYSTVNDASFPIHSTPYFRAASFDLANLNWPVPYFIYAAQPRFELGQDVFSIVFDDYNPTLVVPNQIRTMDTAWRSCALDWKGLYDPPIALTKTSVAAQPTMSTEHSTKEPAAPAPTISSPPVQTTAKEASATAVESTSRSLIDPTSKAISHYIGETPGPSSAPNEPVSTSAQPSPSQSNAGSPSVSVINNQPSSAPNEPVSTPAQPSPSQSNAGSPSVSVINNQPSSAPSVGIATNGQVTHDPASRPDVPSVALVSPSSSHHDGDPSRPSVQTQSDSTQTSSLEHLQTSSNPATDRQPSVELPANTISGSTTIDGDTAALHPSDWTVSEFTSFQKGTDPTQSPVITGVEHTHTSNHDQGQSRAYPTSTTANGDPLEGGASTKQSAVIIDGQTVWVGQTATVIRGHSISYGSDIIVDGTLSLARQPPQAEPSQVLGIGVHSSGPDGREDTVIFSADSHALTASIATPSSTRQWIPVEGNAGGVEYTASIDPSAGLVKVLDSTLSAGGPGIASSSLGFTVGSHGLAVSPIVTQSAASSSLVEHISGAASVGSGAEVGSSLSNDANVVIGSHTVSRGGNGITVDGVALTLGSSGLIWSSVRDTSTPLPAIETGTWGGSVGLAGEAKISLGTTTLTVESKSGEIEANGETLSQGGSAIISNGFTLIAATSGVVVAHDGVSTLVSYSELTPSSELASEPAATQALTTTSAEIGAGTPPSSTSSASYDASQPHQSPPSTVSAGSGVVLRWMYLAVVAFIHVLSMCLAP